MRRLSNRVLIVFLLAIPTSLGTLALSDSAGATGGTICSALSGNLSRPNEHLTECTTSTTGGSGLLSGNGHVDTVTWKNGGTTTFVIKIGSGNLLCPDGSSAIEIRSTVKKSTGAASSITGKVSADVCITGKGRVSLLPGTVWKF